MLVLADKPDLRPLASLIRDVRAAAPDAAVLLVGAMARDVHLLHAYGIALPRLTTDIDLALALEDWAAFQKLRDALLASGAFSPKNKLQHKLVYTPLNIAIDLVPFEGVEDANGNISWPPDNAEVMSLTGYREASASAVTVHLPLDQSLAMVSLSMLAVLKILVWIERHLTEPRKDARDLDAILRNYFSAGNADRLYSEAPHLLDAPTYDYDFSGAWMCGRDARNTLDAVSGRAAKIVAQLNNMLDKETDPDGVLHYVGDLESGNPDNARNLLAAFSAGLNLKPTP
ncbi:MAG: nucleotidyl transferase AbiEii/AbiGii toxin family protein [Burkholderiales bacterium]|nr:nucleotidyl transferase AbiEii/AbiGii toxin family protein [Burkholderiales bacterium]